MSYLDTENYKSYHREYMRRYRLKPERKKYYEDYYRNNMVVIKKRASDGSRKKLYGVTPEQFEEMKLAQGNLCYLCGNPPHGRFSLGVDHNHKTKEVRVLLCSGCNWLAGRIEAIGWTKIKNYGERFL